jgi:hypothetical protein
MQHLKKFEKTVCRVRKTIPELCEKKQQQQQQQFFQATDDVLQTNASGNVQSPPVYQTSARSVEGETSTQPK